MPLLICLVIVFYLIILLTLGNAGSEHRNQCLCCVWSKACWTLGPPWWLWPECCDIPRVPGSPYYFGTCPNDTLFSCFRLLVIFPWERFFFVPNVWLHWQAAGCRWTAGEECWLSFTGWLSSCIANVAVAAALGSGFPDARRERWQESESVGEFMSPLGAFRWWVLGTPFFSQSLVLFQNTANSKVLSWDTGETQQSCG